MIIYFDFSLLDLLTELIIIIFDMIIRHKIIFTIIFNKTLLLLTIS